MKTSIIETVKKNGKVIFGVVAGLGIAAVSVAKAMHPGAKPGNYDDYPEDYEQLEEVCDEPSAEESETE